MIKRSIPSPAMVVACIALFVAMGGTGYAATQLASGKEEASSSKVKRGPRGPRGKRGPQGVQGAQGAQGAPGSAKAWALVSATGSLIRSSNITNVSHPTVGIYCITPANGVNTTNSVGLASLDWADSSVFNQDQITVASQANSFNECAPNTQFEVRTSESTGTLKNDGFSFMVP
jgi:hypothetical protein